MTSRDEWIGIHAMDLVYSIAAYQMTHSGIPSEQIAQFARDAMAVADQTRQEDGAGPLQGAGLPPRLPQAATVSDQQASDAPAPPPAPDAAGVREERDALLVAIDRYNKTHDYQELACWALNNGLVLCSFSHPAPPPREQGEE